jgi:DNA-binding Lrp family transcriptional regulator
LAISIGGALAAAVDWASFLYNQTTNITKLPKEYSMKAYILIKIRAGELKQVVKELRKLPFVMNADMTFGPYDAVAVVEHGDINGIGSLLASSVQTIPGVEQTLTCLAVEL